MPSHVPFLIVLLLVLASFSVVPSSGQRAKTTSGTTTATEMSYTSTYALTSTTESQNPSTVQTTPLAATTSLADKTQTTITGRLAIAYPMDHPARYYLIDNLGSIELIPSPAGVGNLHRYEGATIEVTGNLVSQDNQRILYVENWVTLEAAAFPAVSGPQSTIVILVEFSDNTASHLAAQIGQLVFGASGNAMNAYYIEVSYNSITVTGGYTSVWNKLSHPTTYYNVHDWGSSWSDYRKLAVDVVSLVDPYVNFASYQHYMMVFAGDWVWGARCSGLAISTADGVLVNTATFLRETYGMTVYAHEFGHDLGLPDLYDYSKSDPYNFIDGWDEMSMDNAQHFTSWSKIQLGWIPPSKIATFTGSTVTQTVSRIEYTTSGYHALKIKTSAMPTSFYFLVETRQKVGFDVNLPASAPDHGVLITKIDESKGDGAGIVRLVDANPSTQSSWDGDAVWQVGQTYTDSLYGFSVYVQSWTGAGFTITVSLIYVPHVSTDKTTYAQGEYVYFTGTGFTPGGAISSCISTDNDGAGLCVGQPSANGQGNIAGSMIVGTNIPSGPQKFWVVDLSAGIDSNSVQLSISNSPSTISSLTPDRPSPQVVSTTIVWACSASDPENDPILYRFWLQVGSAPWVVTQDWSSSATWSWTPTATGTYNVGCWVRDGKHAGSTSFDDRKIINGYVIKPNGPPTVSVLAPDKVSGSQAAGSTIVWTASASDPEGDSILYKFWLQAGSGAWVMMQDWSSSNTWNWIPNAAGTYNVGVWVRDGKHAGPTGYDARLIVNGYSVLSGPTVKLSPASGSVGVVVAVAGSGFAAADTGCAISSSPSGLISSPTCAVLSGVVSGSFTVAFGIISGVYSVVVTGSTGDTGGASFTVSNSPPTVSGLSPDKLSPQVVRTTVTWTCSASDPESDPILYRFWLQSGSGVWVLVQDWSSSSNWSWTPSAAGTYNVGCWVRDGKHAAPTSFDARLIINGYVIAPNGPPTVSSLTPDKASPQVVGTTITWTCSATDPDSDSISYRFWLQTGPSIPWVVTQDWSSLSTWSWTPNTSGTYNVGCWVRDGKHAGPTSFDDRKIVYGYAIATASVLIQPPSLTFLTPPLASGDMDGRIHYPRINRAIWSSGRQ